MNKTDKKLNKYEKALQKQVEELMLAEKVKFTVFLPVLRSDLPLDTTSREYRSKHRSEYLKHRRATYTIDEIIKMLDVLGYKLQFRHDKTEISAVPEILQDTRLKYVDMMVTCKLLNIKIEWQKSSIEGTKNTQGNS